MGKNYLLMKQNIVILQLLEIKNIIIITILPKLCLMDMIFLMNGCIDYNNSINDF